MWKICCQCEVFSPVTHASKPIVNNPGFQIIIDRKRSFHAVYWFHKILSKIWENRKLYHWIKSSGFNKIWQRYCLPWSRLLYGWTFNTTKGGPKMLCFFLKQNPNFKSFGKGPMCYKEFKILGIIMMLSNFSSIFPSSGNFPEHVRWGKWGCMGGGSGGRM